MKKIYAFLVLLTVMAAGKSDGQIAAYDTLKIMTYNTLNYGFPATTGCLALLSYNKHIWLRTILKYTDPDILGLEKMTASPASFTTDTIVQKVLDSVCPGCYAHTPFTNVSGYYKENMLYYKTSKIGWLSTTTIYSGDSNISDINLHRLFYKSPTLSSTHDTIFLNVILVHLESGAGNAAERATEMTGATNWLHAHITARGNFIFMGDMNTQSSGETCYQLLVNSPDSNTLFFDPIYQPGMWDNDPTAFADYLTQSTRTSDPGDCGATGGMDDRFDHILCSYDLMDGGDSLQYLSGSYETVGQDGQHVNKSIIANPVNSSVPSTVLSSLYYMSEHLPVMLQLGVLRKPLNTGIINAGNEHSEWTYSYAANDKLQIKYKGEISPDAASYTITIYSIDGKKLIQSALNNAALNIIQTYMLSSGIYILEIRNNEASVLTGRFIRIAQ